MTYKHVHKPLADIGRELDVQAVVEGTVFRSGDRVRLSAKLIRVPADVNLWAQSYEGDPQYAEMQARLAAFRAKEGRPPALFIAKMGQDGHDRGAKVIARALRDAGMEVIYTGLHQSPEMIANAAVQEDADVIGLSILSGAHMTLFPRVLNLLREAGRDDVLITGGGIIPKEDMDELQRLGTGKLFGPGTSTSDLVDYIRAWFAEREGAGARAGER